MDDTGPQLYTVKCLMVGPSQTGKTSLMRRFADDCFTTSPEATCRYGYRKKDVSVGNTTVRMEMWDLSGDERFLHMSKGLFRQAQCKMLVYDICSQTSFDRVPFWLDTILSYHATSPLPHPYVMLVGNKRDKEAGREVSTESGAAYAEASDILFTETSALEDISVASAFHSLCDWVCRDIEGGVVEAQHFGPQLIETEPALNDTDQFGNCFCQ
ncbi:small GTPase superfamily, Rho type [Kipferlia bialata]|uniref:Small GTPase superfamily, Rho type n=1 Tax=Kipferlia bialata TaxID=797122 RepID=A0A9K3CTH8_9EUKA|nr:small GTPase superfamily, Rho type [Kipferlia bialata]|eukprot:g3476.t1